MLLFNYLDTFPKLYHLETLDFKNLHQLKVITKLEFIRTEYSVHIARGI